ncbi:MAG: lysophospholipase [Oscillospiraceae bacterium]|nr:lysophospholipase [Oscillospiraceae bacterium]
MARMTESTFLSCDGKTELYYREYLPEGNAVGIVQIVHGIAEHVARYDDFAGFLADNGYIVVAHDQLGHGKSVAGEDSIGFFSEEGGWGKAVEDIHKLHDLTAERYPGKPYFIFGHSMGSFLTRTYLIRYRTGLDGAVISGTGQQSGALIAGGKMMSALEIKRHGPRYKSELLNKMAFGSYNDKLGDIRTGFDWLSRNEAVVDAYIDDPLCGFVPSAALLHDMMGGIEFISKPKNIARMKKDLPVMFMSGDCDPVGEQGRGVIRAYKAFLKAGMTDVTMKLYHGGRHEMLNELNKNEVYQDVLAWLNSKTGN